MRSYGIDVGALNMEQCWDDARLALRLPSVAAASRVLRSRLTSVVRTARAQVGDSARLRGTLTCTAYAGARQQRQDPPNENPTRSHGLRITGISGGSSGLASIAGDSVLVPRWVDLSSLLRALNSDIAIVTGCRQPVEVNAVSPDFFFECIGPVSSAFDATCILFPRDPLAGEPAVQWRADLSQTNRITVGTTRQGSL